MNVKCDKCGELIDNKIILEVEKNAVQIQQEVPYSVLKHFIDREESNLTREWAIRFVKLESLGIILYYTSTQNWDWKWVLALCIIVFTLFNSRRFRTVYVFCLSLVLGYIIPFDFLPIEKNQWWYAIFIVIISLVFHMSALIKDKKISDIMN